MFSNESLQMLSNVSLAGFALVFVIGLVMAFNPRSVMVIPVIVSYLVGNRSGEKEPPAWTRALAFVVGMTAADVALGILFAYIGVKVGAIFGQRWEAVIGIILIFLGLRWLGVLRFRTVGLQIKAIKAKKANSLAGAFFLGIPFSMSFCPFCTPILLTILTVAAATGKIWYSAVLMLFFSLGRGLPLLIAGVSVDIFKKMQFFEKYIPAFEKAGGVVLVAAGLYYLLNFSRYLTIL